ncbi:MAG: carbonic anhydrase family protein [Aggregatilineales bacterium]
MFKQRFMTLTLLVFFSLSLFALPISAQDDDHEGEPPHWEYEGEAGPENWGDLSEDFALCGMGTAQSPIDISGASALNLTDIAFAYADSALNIFNNGHTIQVNVDEGSSISYNGISYDLLQFHFHHPSEHVVDGVPADMEIHFVHRDPNSGNLAVVGVLLMAGEEANAEYAAVFDHLPAEVGEADAMGNSVDVASLIPADAHYTTYNGSLTTPPCSEIVRWLVLDTPVTLSAEQIEAFAAIHEMNARPVQPLNGRDLLEDNE